MGVHRILFFLLILALPQTVRAEMYTYNMIMWRGDLCRKQTAPPNLIIDRCAKLIKAGTNQMAIIDEISLLAGAYYRKGSPDLGQKHHALVVKMTNEGTETDFKSPWWLNARCWSKAVGKIELESAIADCDRALQLYSDRAEIIDSKALVLYQQGKYQDALQSYNDALKIKPGYASSLFMRGAVKAKLGDTEGSKGDFVAAREANDSIDVIYQSYGLTFESSR